MYEAPTEEDVRRVVDLAVEAVDPLRVVLFGSLARGDEDPGDIDLIVVMPDGANRLHVGQALRRLIVTNPDLNVAVDIVVTTPARLERSQRSVVSMYPEILREGRELYVATVS